MIKKIKMIKKKCIFPNCEEEFVAYPQTKYCEEHRDTKYRKFLPKKIRIPYPNDNFKYQHDNNKVTTLQRQCGHEGCNNIYEIIIYPGQYTYCNFCEEHRNPYKRRK